MSIVLAVCEWKFNTIYANLLYIYIMSRRTSLDFIIVKTEFGHLLDAKILL